MTEDKRVQLAVDTIRTLSIDAVQAAKSDHPGTHMALAPLVYTIWNRVMHFDPAQLDNDLNTFSGELIWTPTTGEYGRANGFGDFEGHEKVATRLAVHFTRSDENRQGSPTPRPSKTLKSASQTEASSSVASRSPWEGTGPCSRVTSWCISEEVAHPREVGTKVRAKVTNLARSTPACHPSPT